MKKITCVFFSSKVKITVWHSDSFQVLAYQVNVLIPLDKKDFFFPSIEERIFFLGWFDLDNLKDDI